MLLDLVLVFLFTFILTCFILTYYQQQKHCLQDDEINIIKYCLLNLVHRLWTTILKFFKLIEQVLINILECTSDSFCIDKFLDPIEFGLNDTCPVVSNENNILKELNELSNIIYENYIDFWYENIRLTTEQQENINFKFYVKKTIEDSFYNFYRLCSEKVDIQKLLFKLVQEIESHLLELNNVKSKLRLKDEMTLLLDLLDDIFQKVLPPDVNLLLTKCKCCDNGAKKSCLNCSENPVRLFIYNLFIHSLLLPLFDRLTHPLYFLYNYICLLSAFGGMSLTDFTSQFERIEYDDKDGEAQSIPFQISPEDQLNDKLLYEAIEESKKELMIFSNIRIANVRISTNEALNSMSKMNPYIDYIIVFNVLECDKEGEKQLKIHLKRANKQTFLQRTYQVKRRFREFLSFQQKLEKNIDFRLKLARISYKPSNIQFHSSTFLNYIKSTKITEHSPLVKTRKDCLERFLNLLSKHKEINDSKEFCEFLGYKYKSTLEVRQLLAASLDSELIENKAKTNVKNFDFNLKNVKEFFRVLLPTQAKYGQLSTQLEDVMFNEQIRNKYSIMKIEPDSNEDNHMLLKLKLESWATFNTGERGQNISRARNSENDQIDEEEFNQKIISCLFLIFFRGYFAFHRFFVSRCFYFAQHLFSKFRNMLTFHRIFKFYIHYLHTNLNGFENESIDSYLVSYDRFYILFKDQDRNELFAKYVYWSKQMLIEQCNHSPKPFKVHLCKIAFFLCDYFALSDNLVASFNNQTANKLLFYKLLKIFQNEIKNIS